MALVCLNIIFTSSRLLLVHESSLLTTITELKASAWDHSQLPPPFYPSSDSPAQVQTRWNLCVDVCDFFQGAKDCSRKIMWSVWVTREVHEHWKHPHPSSLSPLPTSFFSSTLSWWTCLVFVDNRSNPSINDSISKSSALNSPLNSKCKLDIFTWLSWRHLKFSVSKYLY